MRRCHGDLHLANIVLIKDKPILFDALEFDETLATVDVLHDLSFTLMDLIRHGCVEAANVVLNRYLDVTERENLEALGLLPLFMSMRAAVRANVMQCRSTLMDGDRTAMEDAAAYFALATSLLQPKSPCLVAIGGLSGTGKTAVARMIAFRVGAMPGAVILRSDALRKRMHGVGELDRLPPSAYTPDASAQVYRQLEAEATTVLRQGHSAIVDAVFAQSSERLKIEFVARRAEARFAGMYLTADRAVRVGRIESRINDASDATAAVADAQESYDLGHISWPQVDAAGSLERTSASCAALLPAACARL